MELDIHTESVVITSNQILFFCLQYLKLKINYFIKIMEGFGEKENRDLIQFLIKGIEEGNSEVANPKLLSDCSRIFVNNEPIYQEIEINYEQPSGSHSFGMVNKASNNQYLLNSSLLHKSQVTEIGEELSEIPNSENIISTVNHDIVMQINVPNVHETFSSQVACLSSENLKTDEALLCNSKLEDGRPFYNISSRSTYQSVSNDMLIAKKVHASDKKRHLSNEDNSEIHNRYRQEICRIRDQVISTCSESGDMNYHIALNKSETTKRTTFNYGCFGDSLNIKESHCHNQGMHEQGNSKKNLGLNIASNSNALQSPLNENAPSEIPYSRESKEFLRSIDDILVLPGPSGIHQNKKASDSSGEKFQSIVSLERRSVEAEKEMLICKFCENEISEHGVAYQGKNLYKCCRCSFKSEENDFHIHIEVCGYLHYFCNVCNEIYTDNSLHSGVQTCNTCEQKFPCMGLLEQHSIDHESYYHLYCRVCRIEIDKHINDAELRYQCCLCSKKCKTKHQLQSHLYIHSDLRLFKCNMCSKRYKQYPVLLQHLRIVHDVKKPVVLSRRTST